MCETPPPRRPEHTIGEQAKEFFYNVGVALTDWAQIDEQLFNLCAEVLKTDGHLAAIVYYRTNTLGARLALVDELVRSALPQTERKSGAHPSEIERSWVAIRSSMSKLLETRNHLAHSPASPQAEFSSSAELTQPVATDVWWASYVSGTEKMRGKEPKKDLKLDDVKAHLAKIGTLWMELRNFRGALSALLR